MWDRYSLFWEIEKYSHYYDKNPPRFGKVGHLRRWLLDTFGWSPEPLGNLAVIEAVLWFLGCPEAKPPKKMWCCDLGDRPSTYVRKISVEEMRRLRSEGESMAAIGRIAGISRERVRQLLKD